MYSAKPSLPTSSSRNLEDTLKSPTHHLFLNKVIVHKDSSVSINELVPPLTPSAGIRAQIGHLLPRHANFRARIQIHQISSVPFVSGEFGVRWKFKGVQSSSSTKKGLLGRVKSKKGKHSKDDKGKGRDISDGEFLAGTDNHEVAQPVMPVFNNVATELPASRPPPDCSASVDPIENDAHTSSYISSSKSSVTVPSYSHSTLHCADSSSSSHIFNSPSANASHVAMVPEIDSSDPSATAVLTLRRGTTPFLKLKDHSVAWCHTLDTLLKFDIDRETYQIQPHPLKLVVMQRIIPDDPGGSPQNPRLGAVYLNLAEYIGKGSVERSYLLKESKTNAVLKVTIILFFY